MKIPSSSDSQKSLNFRKKLFYALLFLFLYTLIGTYLAIYFYRQGYYHRFIQAIKVAPQIPSNYLKSYGVKVESIQLDIKHKQFLKLSQKRDEALNKGVLVQSDDDYIPAQLSHQNKKVDIKIRLKGDWINHLNSDKWSFRVKVKGENSIMGIKNFSLQHPKTRNYMYEWVYQQFMHHEGILNIRYHFVELIINGKNKGIYALEEHFEKRLIENNQLKESPIFRYDDSLIWDDIVHFQNSPDSIWEDEALKSVKVSPFVKSSLKENPTLKNNYIYAASLLDAFRARTLKPSAVFDAEKIAIFLALQDLLGAHHGSGVSNSVFYYNPNTSKIEPISFDGNSGPLYNKPYLCANYRNPMISLILEDHEVFKLYIHYLEKFSQKDYLETVFKKIETQFNKHTSILFQEFPDKIFDLKHYYNNQQKIHAALNPETFINAYTLNLNSDQIQILVENIRIFPIQIKHLELINGQKIFSLNENIIEQKRSHRSYPRQKKLIFICEENTSEAVLNSPIKVYFNILGSSKTHSAIVNPWPKNKKEWYQRNPLLQKSNIDKFSFLKKIDSQNYEISSGNHFLTQDLYIPKGLTITANSAFTLTLSANSSLYSQSSFNLKPQEGTILIQSDLSGGGIYLYNCEDKSHFSNIIFKNLRNPQKDSWSLTGAMTLYQSDSLFENCRFENAQCEDSLNIVRSSFELSHCQINHSRSDAFDADFCKGSISYSQFNHNGNDAIDVSGSQLDMKNITIINSGDKALSAGEKSYMKGKHIRILDSEVGVASKDQSEVDINYVDIRNTRVAFTAYKKKSEFGPATLNVGAHVKTKDIEELGLVEEGSSIKINSKEVEVNSEKVKELMYGNEYGRASR